LKAIQCIISGNTATDLERNIETKLDEIAEEINSLERTYYSMKAFMERLKNGVDLLNIKESLEVEDVSIETIRPTNLVYTRKTMANYANAEVSLDRWVELSNLCDELDLKSDGSYIVTYHSNPLEQFLYTDTDIEFGISVEDVGSAKDFRTFGNFTAATAIHLGNYADIMQTHVRLVQWINKNQYRIVGPVSEEFIISPLDINNINEHVTKIIIPVEKIQKNKNEEQ
jgi:effector-binding domain-containing protein